MESITIRIKKETEKRLHTFSKDKSFQDLQKFYSEMKEKGIAKKQGYNIPPLDTVGHYLYQTIYHATTPSQIQAQY